MFSESISVYKDLNAKSYQASQTFATFAGLLRDYEE